MSETGEMVYKRTYSRVKPDGSSETWPETVQRVVDGNLAFVDERHRLPGEREDLIRMMTELKLLPAGRHLWATGVKGSQFLMNCHVAPWPDNIAEHFRFVFSRLMEGGGVGSNYSNSYLRDYPLIQHFLEVEIVCDPAHPDYEELEAAGVLSTRYSPDWDGAYVIGDSREGWAEALVDLIETHYRPDTVHLNRVYDVSNVRPAGSKLKTFGGTASGPLPLAKMLREVSEVFNLRTEFYPSRLNGLDAMQIDHAIAQCVVAGGVRRSARMAIMHWDDPQIETFAKCKESGMTHWTTNISIEVDDRFWLALEGGGDPHPGYRGDLSEQGWAEKVLRLLAEGAHANGEPGMWDSSMSNVGEPNRVVATNPCAEFALEESECCNLGHVNLAAFVNDLGRYDWADLRLAHRLMTRFLMRATFSDFRDPAQREVQDRNRRIGVGHLGVASFMAMTGLKFSEAPESERFRYLLLELAAAVDEEATSFAHQLRIPIPVKRRTIAPTGTVSKLAGVSEGIHPIFAPYFIRRIRLSRLDPRQVETIAQYEADGFLVEDCVYDSSGNTAVVSIATKDILLQAVEDIYGEERARELVESASDLTINQHLAVQALYQRDWADNAVSYTVNFDPKTATPDDIANAIYNWGQQIKGTTLFPEASMAQSPYEKLTKEEFDAALAKAVADGVDENCANGSCPIR
ncbi:ribonucleoside-triphosphate reductase, adenosylcobalamin-dependent [Nocardia sp. NPDC055002]